MLFNLCAIVNSGAIDNTQSNNNSPNTPINTQTIGIDLNNGGLVVISIIIILLVIAITILGIYISKYNGLKSELNEIHKNEDLNKTASEEEVQILSKYNNLNEQERKLIDDTLTTLNNKNNN